MSEPSPFLPMERRDRRRAAWAIGSCLAPVAGAVALLFAATAEGFALIGGIVMALAGSGVAGTVLALGSLIRRERWPLLGVLGLLINTVPSIALFIAIIVHRSQL